MQLSDDAAAFMTGGWHPLMLAAHTRCDPWAGAATCHRNQQPCSVASCSRRSTQTVSNYTAPWDVILLQIPCTTASNPFLSCIWEAGARRVCSQKCLSPIYSTHRAKAVYYNPLALMSAWSVYTLVPFTSNWTKTFSWHLLSFFISLLYQS